MNQIITEVWISVSPETTRDLIGSLLERMIEIINVIDVLTNYEVYK